MYCFISKKEVNLFIKHESERETEKEEQLERNITGITLSLPPSTTPPQSPSRTTSNDPSSCSYPSLTTTNESPGDDDSSNSKLSISEIDSTASSYRSDDFQGIWLQRQKQKQGITTPLSAPTITTTPRVLEKLLEIDDWEAMVEDSHNYK